MRGKSGGEQADPEHRENGRIVYGRVEKVPINRCETPLSVTNLLAGWPTPRHDEINEIR